MKNLDRRAVAGAAFACIAVLAAACGSPSGSSGSASGPSSPSSSSASPTQAAAPTATSAPATTPVDNTATAATPAAAAGSAACPTRALAVKLGSSEGTAGSVYTTILFTNTGTVTCTLYGYPGVSFTSAPSSGAQLGAAATRSGTPAPELVRLAPGAVANAVLRIVDAGNYPAATCGPVTAHELQIYPPNQTAPVYLASTSQACSKPVQILTVSVVQPGTSGSA